MNLDDLKQWLLERGFKIYYQGDQYKPWLAAKNIEHRTKYTCATNSGNLNIIVTAFEFPEHFGAEVDIRGEACGQWYQLKAYGFSPESLTQQYAAVEARLVAAWDAIHEA